MSVLLTITLSIAWSLVFKPKHRKTGFCMVAACYLSLIVIYLLEGTSLYWLGLVTPLSLILGLLMAFRGLRQIVFHSRNQEPIKTETKTMQKTVAKVGKEDMQQKIFNEFERRNIPLQEEKQLSNMTLGELLKEADRNGVEIRAREK